VTNYYVYYRVDKERVEGLRLSVHRLFKVIEKETGVLGRWMRRRDDPSTYMEVYEGVRDGAAFEALLERESKGLGLQRRNEIFTEFPNQ
jgi:hypothetical protein